MTGIEANALVCASFCVVVIMLHASQITADLEHSHIYEHTLMLSLLDCSVDS